MENTNGNQSSGLQCRKDRKKFPRKPLQPIKTIFLRKKETLEISDSTYQRLHKGYDNGNFDDVSNFKRDPKKAKTKELVFKSALNIYTCMSHFKIKKASG